MASATSPICGIYQIRRLSTGQCYVGSSVNVRLRWNSHRSLLRRGLHHSPHLQNAWNKYGEGAFAFEVFLESLPAELRALEQSVLNARLRAGLLYNHTTEVQSHGGSLKGERHGRASLNQGQVLEVFEALMNEDDFFEVAARYDVSPETIRAIYYGRTWKHIPRPRFPERKRRPRYYTSIGSKRPRAKLTEDIVRQARKKYAEANGKRGIVAELARRFGVNDSTMYQAVVGQTWSHVCP